MNPTMMKDLNELKMLNQKSALNESEANRWEAICAEHENKLLLRLLDALDDDKDLTDQLLKFQNDTGSCMQQIAYGGIGIGLYLLQKLYPTYTMCNDDQFVCFWLESCHIQDTVVNAVNNAIDRAIAKIIAEEESMSIRQQTGCYDV